MKYKRGSPEYWKIINDKRKEYHHRYYLANKEEILARQKAYRKGKQVE